MLKRIRAAWRGFCNPDPSAAVTVQVDADAVIAAIRKQQRRRGLPPTV